MDARPSARADPRQRLHRPMPKVSMDARPSARADLSDPSWISYQPRVSMDARPSARADGSPHLFTLTLPEVSMDARPSARADFDVTVERPGPHRLNGCPAERAGGLTVRTYIERTKEVSMDARPSARADLWVTTG